MTPDVTYGRGKTGGATPAELRFVSPSAPTAIGPLSPAPQPFRHLCQKLCAG